MVIGPPYIRFYAAFPIKAADGKKMGVFCIKDRKPRKLNRGKLELLKSLSAWAELELNTHELHIAISARETAETRIAELNEVLRLLHKSLKHDLLNNLTVIKGYIGMYLKSKKDELLKSVLASVDQSATSIKQMGELESSVSAGAPLKQYDLRKIIDQISIYFPQVKLKISGQGIVLADEAIVSVVENLIRNAQDHGKTKQLNISIHNHNSWVKVNFKDFGEGIPNSIKDKLCQEGFKYGETGNTGLGLYIIKRTIERYGGGMEIKDSKPRGTSIMLKLPTAKNF